MEKRERPRGWEAIRGLSIAEDGETLSDQRPREHPSRHLSNVLHFVLVPLRGRGSRKARRPLAVVLRSARKKKPPGNQRGASVGAATLCIAGASAAGNDPVHESTTRPLFGSSRTRQASWYTGFRATWTPMISSLTDKAVTRPLCGIRNRPHSEPRIFA
jgi:hypothetical protein